MTESVNPTPVQAAFAEYWESIDGHRRHKQNHDQFEGAFVAGALWAAMRTRPDEVRERMDQLRRAVAERRAEREHLILRFEEIDAQPADFLEHVGPTHRDDREFLLERAGTVRDVVNYFLDDCGDTVEWLEELLDLMIGEDEEAE